MRVLVVQDLWLVAVLPEVRFEELDPETGLRWAITVGWLCWSMSFMWGTPSDLA